MEQHWGRDFKLTWLHWWEVTEEQKSCSEIIGLLFPWCEVRCGHCSTSGCSSEPARLQRLPLQGFVAWKKVKTPDIFHFFIISSHSFGMSPVEIFPVLSCLPQAKHPGLDSQLCPGIFSSWHQGHCQRSWIYLSFPSDRNASKHRKAFVPVVLQGDFWGVSSVTGVPAPPGRLFHTLCCISSKISALPQ